MEGFQTLQQDILDMAAAIPLLNGKTVKEHTGISDKDLLNLYAFACHFFNKGKLNEAELYFRQLVLMDSSNLDYILGLGAVLQRKKLYARATDAFAIAHMMQKGDSRPMFYAGQCNFFERKYSKAKYCFEIVVEQNYSEKYVKMAKLFLDAIEKNKKQENNND